MTPSSALGGGLVVRDITGVLCEPEGEGGGADVLVYAVEHTSRRELELGDGRLLPDVTLVHWCRFGVSIWIT